MCTAGVYQSGQQKPITINSLLILLGFLCRWRRERNSNFLLQFKFGNFRYLPKQGVHGSLSIRVSD
jgi:hypothetical protein